ncbi:uncharacterized protein N7487_008211 [Penicillium crustosum]|uniref:uncharacterized protein n=1 Tax=Penicillium crustosum TaxID=36656 RepID=UPI0023939FDE|nr:uncharacterized protein N7487_008211 [Penicillium crustosum]KAJ5402315.1 hypothetical protein N7487_008211 [Penicillium crustosum]
MDIILLSMEAKSRKRDSERRKTVKGEKWEGVDEAEEKTETDRMEKSEERMKGREMKDEG